MLRTKQVLQNSFYMGIQKSKEAFQNKKILKKKYLISMIWKKIVPKSQKYFAVMSSVRRRKKTAWWSMKFFIFRKKQTNKNKKLIGCV